MYCFQTTSAYSMTRVSNASQAAICSLIRTVGACFTNNSADRKHQLIAYSIVRQGPGYLKLQGRRKTTDKAGTAVGAVASAAAEAKQKDKKKVLQSDSSCPTSMQSLIHAEFGNHASFVHCRHACIACILHFLLQVCRPA